MILSAESERMSISEGNAKLLTSFMKTPPLSGVENEAHHPWGMSNLTALSLCYPDLRGHGAWDAWTKTVSCSSGVGTSLPGHQAVFSVQVGDPDVI